MKIKKAFCFCWIAKLQQRLKNQFYDAKTQKYKYAWVMYLVLGLYLLHWIWHIAIGATIVGFLYQQCS